MMMLRLWDAEMAYKFTTRGSEFRQMRSDAEQFFASYDDGDLLHWTVDFSDPPSHRTRLGGRLTREGSGFRWEDNHEHLPRILLPATELAKYQLDKPLGPGDRIAVEVGGVLYTDTIESISPVTSDREPVSAPRRPWWRRVLRALTPRRYREPELWAPPGGNLPTLAITTVGDGPPYLLGRDIVLGERQDLTDPAYWTDTPE